MKPIFTENFPGNMLRTIGKAERVEKGGAHTDTDEVRRSLSQWPHATHRDAKQRQETEIFIDIFLLFNLYTANHNKH